MTGLEAEIHDMELPGGIEELKKEHVKISRVNQKISGLPRSV